MRTRLGLLVLALLAPAVVACGDDDPDAASVVATAAPATTAGAAPTTAGAAPTTAGVAGTTAPDERTLVDFAEPAAADGWTTVNDTVMGGVSDSTATWDDRRLVFTGTVSLENNGGFASVRGPVDPGIGTAADGATGIVVRAQGDGKVYVLQFRGDDGLHIQRFTTEPGTERSYVLPVEAFVPVTQFLDELPGGPPLDPATVTQLAVFVLDGQEGPFRLELGSVTATDVG